MKLGCRFSFAEQTKITSLPSPLAGEGLEVRGDCAMAKRISPLKVQILNCLEKVVEILLPSVTAPSPLASLPQGEERGASFVWEVRG